VRKDSTVEQGKGEGETFSGYNKRRGADSLQGIRGVYGVEERNGFSAGLGRRVDFA